MTQTPVLKNKNLHIIFLITLMAVLGVASITPAFPQIAQQLGIAKHSIGMLIIVFTLPGIILTPVLGVLADRLGRKTVLVPSLLLFGLAGGACSLARQFELLLVFRFMQGVGAAALGALNITIIGDLFSGKQRAAAMGYNASVLSIATASYPFLGGLLATFGWYFPFYLPFLAIPVGAIVLWQLDIPKPQQTQKLGPYLRNAFHSLKNRHAILYFGASMGVFIILYGSYLTYVPIFLAETFAAKPYQIGMVMASMSAVTAITSSQTGRLARRFSEKLLLRSSFIFYALSLVFIPFVPKMWLIVVPLIFYGMGQGINIPSLQTLLTGLAPIEYRAAFMSMNGMVLRGGQTLGPVIMGGVYLVGGLRWPFFAGAVFSLGLFAALVILGRQERKASQAHDGSRL